MREEGNIRKRTSTSETLSDFFWQVISSLLLLYLLLWMATETIVSSSFYKKDYCGDNFLGIKLVNSAKSYDLYAYDSELLILLSNMSSLISFLALFLLNYIGSSLFRVTKLVSKHDTQALINANSKACAYMATGRLFKIIFEHFENSHSSDSNYSVIKWLTERPPQAIMCAPTSSGFPSNHVLGLMPYLLTALPLTWTSGGGAAVFYQLIASAAFFGIYQRYVSSWHSILQLITTSIIVGGIDFLAKWRRLKNIKSRIEKHATLVNLISNLCFLLGSVEFDFRKFLDPKSYNFYEKPTPWVFLNLVATSLILLGVVVVPRVTSNLYSMGNRVLPPATTSITSSGGIFSRKSHAKKSAVSSDNDPTSGDDTKLKAS